MKKFERWLKELYEGEYEERLLALRELRDCLDGEHKQAVIREIVNAELDCVRDGVCPDCLSELVNGPGRRYLLCVRCGLEC